MKQSLMLLAVCVVGAFSTAAEASAVRIDSAEAESVLAILSVYADGDEPTEDDWAALFATEGYRRLKEREHAMKRAFDDSSFKEFVRSPALAMRAAELHATVARWSEVDFDASVRKISAYLPERANIRATVYFVIKPRSNSFVFDLSGDPAIFFYVDPAVPAAKFENTVAHELHHVGLHGAASSGKTWPSDDDSPLGDARSYIGAFGEGFAMLAAAGGPDVDPQAFSPDSQRTRWDKDMAHFSRDLRAVDAFLLDVATGRLDHAAARKKAMATFWGDAQGAWYTVGYRMAVLIEESFGRARLLDCMADLSLLLPTYNEAARKHNEAAADPLPLWSEKLLTTLER